MRCRISLTSSINALSDMSDLQLGVFNECLRCHHSGTDISGRRNDCPRLRECVFKIDLQFIRHNLSLLSPMSQPGENVPSREARAHFTQSIKANDSKKLRKKSSAVGRLGEEWGNSLGRRQLGRRHSCRRWRADGCAFPAATGMSPPQLLSPPELLRFFRVRRAAASAPSVVKKRRGVKPAPRCDSNSLKPATGMFYVSFPTNLFPKFPRSSSTLFAIQISNRDFHEWV